MDVTSYKKPEYFRNRELSWISFDERVLNEARDKSIPLFERLKFISITSSNLDEFYMVRVASLKDQVHANYTKKDLSGMDAKEQLTEISKRTHELVQLQYNTYNRSAVPSLELSIMARADLASSRDQALTSYHLSPFPQATRQKSA